MHVQKEMEQLDGDEWLQWQRRAIYALLQIGRRNLENCIKQFIFICNIKYFSIYDVYNELNVFNS